MRYSNIKVYRPESLEEALTILSTRKEKVRIVAGSTDVTVMMRSGTIEEELLDLSGLRRSLAYIGASGDGVEIGALATYMMLLSNVLVHERVPLLAEAMRTIGSPQIRNMGTLVGNVANASPAGDTIPPLYVLGADIVLEGISGTRNISVDEFFLGVGKTARRPDELITRIIVGGQPPGSRGFFEKLGLRRAMAISVVSVAGLISLDHGVVADARIALGAVAPTVIRAPGAEGRLKGEELTDDVMWDVAEAAARDAKPITDVRGTAGYRRMVVASLVYRGLSRVAHELEVARID